MNNEKWVRYEPLTDTYDTCDGTSVSAFVLDDVRCFADVLHISRIRDAQRKYKVAKEKSGG